MIKNGTYGAHWGVRFHVALTYQRCGSEVIPVSSHASVAMTAPQHRLCSGVMPLRAAANPDTFDKTHFGAFMAVFRTRAVIVTSKFYLPRGDGKVIDGQKGSGWGTVRQGGGIKTEKHHAINGGRERGEV